MRIPFKALLGSVAALSSAAALGIASTTGAHAASPVSASHHGSSNPVIHDAATTAAERQRVVHYWTPARMKRARSPQALVADKDRSTATHRVAMSSPSTVAPTSAAMATATPTSANTGSYYSGGGKVAATTGKVFFTKGGTDYVCSGSSISSKNKNTVLTAGHCVNAGGDSSGTGAFVKNWVFVPGYRNGKRPHGTYTARQLVTTSQWKKSSNFNYDIGFAVVHRRHGHHLVNRVGGEGIAFNRKRGQNTYAFGYPQESPYNGSKIAWCHGKTIRDTEGTKDQGLKCNMTGGSSGGPWLISYSNHAGLANSVNSFKYTSGSHQNYMWGPWFGDAAKSLYNRASRL